MWKYSDLASARRPHSEEIPISTFYQLSEIPEDEFRNFDVSHADSGSNSDYEEALSRNKREDLLSFFSHESNLVFFNDVNGLL